MLNLKKKNIYRLDDYIKPVLYDIKLHPDIESKSFSGFETIDVKLEKDLRKIKIHSKELEVFNVFVIQNDIKFVPIKIDYDQKKELVLLSFKNYLKKGKAKIGVSFRGILNDKMRGFYLSKYHLDGKEEFLATTQFEANDARRAIPSFDEPNKKAVFKISIIIPTNKEVISNMLPETISDHSDGYKIVSFHKTPVMSTYLLAFLVGNFEYLESKTKKGVNIRIITTPGKKDQGKFALSVATRCLEFYEDYFNIDYPLNTLDMIAIPDFESGAMENWGAITYRETALLIDENHSSISNKQRVAIVICHELAHQWFGNLVTMDWWNDLWLNEGFASYMEYVAVDNLFPEWNIWTHFLFNDHSRALRLDSLNSTHKIDVDVHNPNDIGQIFDAISYSKGASLIKQLAYYIGHDNFKNGLRVYLKKHSYKNTKTLDLWHSFEKISKKPVLKIMDYWTKKPGYPIVFVSLNKNNTLSLRQERFFEFNNFKKDKSIWPIPISLISDKNLIHNYLFNKKKTNIHNISLNWIKLNSDENGFFRVSYDDALLSMLKNPIKNNRLSEKDRFGVLRDVLTTSFKGYVSFEKVFNFIESYSDEKEYSLWLEITDFFLKIDKILEDSESKNTFKNYVIEFMTPIYKFVGFSKITNEDESISLLRSLVLNTLVNFEDDRVIKWSLLQIKRKNQIEPNLRGVVYNSLSKKGGNLNFKILLNKYKETDNHQEKIRILQHMGLFKDSKIIKFNLDFMFSKYVRLQDSIYLFSSVTSFKEGRVISIDYMNKNWDNFAFLSSARNMFSDFIKSFSRSNDKKEKKKIESLFFKKGITGIELAFSQTIENIENNILIKDKFSKELYKLFTKN
jgi:puromycin-sensitive aminopeptidase